MPLALRLIPVVAVAVAAAGLSPALGAQAAERTTAPVKGTWGAEAGIGSFDDASVIRFLSPSWAFLAGGFLTATDGGGVGSSRTDGQTTVAFQAGIRKYHRSGLGVRPITGFGLTVGRIASVTRAGGIYGEGGAAYLFNPHLSAGAVARAGLSRDGDRNTFSFVAPRVLVSIFF
jgi:hypothetical protein